MRIHRAVLSAVLAALSLIVVRAALDEDRVAKARPAASTSTPSPTPSVPQPPEEGWLTEPVWTNYPVPALSESKNHCPSDHVPDGSGTLFDPESGRIEIDFYDAGHERSRIFILDVRDPDCFEFAATRGALFAELTLAVQRDTSDEGFWEACDLLREAIKRGFLKLGERPFDLTIARPYVGEVCHR